MDLLGEAIPEETSLLEVRKTLSPFVIGENLNVVYMVKISRAV